MTTAKAAIIEDIYPLSPTQQGMLFHTLQAPASGLYVVQLICRLDSKLKVGDLEQCWRQIIQRHAVFRTSFLWENRDEPLQVVQQPAVLPWIEIDLTGVSGAVGQACVDAYLASDRVRGFELSRAPLSRFTLFRLGGAGYVFVWSHHHLLLDGWSIAIVLNEVGATYEAYSRGEHREQPRPRIFRDFVTWLSRQDGERAEAFWRELLDGIAGPTSLEVPQSSEWPVNSQSNYQRSRVQLSAARTAAWRSLAANHNLTLSNVMHGLWALLLSRYSGLEEVVFGTTVSGRPPVLAGVESMVGMFINTLPIRVKVAPDAQLGPWLKDVQIRQVKLSQFEYSSLSQVQRWSKVPAGMPLFETILIFENYPSGRSLGGSAGTLKAESLSFLERTNYPITLTVDPGDGLEISIAYDSDRFGADTIERMLAHLKNLLECAPALSVNQLRDLSLLSSTERQQLIFEWNKTEAEYPKDKCIHDMFEDQIKESGDAVALVFEGRHLTYRSLNLRATRLGLCLGTLGVRPESLVAIFIERSLELVIGLLGILKAGAAYVPLDPSHPRERLQLVLEDAKVSVLLTQRSLKGNLTCPGASCICIEDPLDPLPVADLESPNCGALPDNLAYVTYTSGSTGKPKGVQITHRSVVNFLASIRTRVGLRPLDRFLSVTTIAFDIAGLELYLPLCVGASCVIVSQNEAADGAALMKRLVDSDVAGMQGTPATWRLLLEAGWRGDQRLEILCGGETLSRELAERLLESGGPILNLYGPTETTIWSTFYPCEPAEKSVPIGRPLANTSVYLLDASLSPSPIGLPGELFIGGAGVARGYLDLADLTAEKFIPDPFSAQMCARFYKTGDLARYLANGNAGFLGRMDHQIKLRGHRIELGEIETALVRHPSIKEAVVSVEERRDKRLVAYVTKNGGAEPDPAELRAFLTEKLPAYMAPAAYIFLDALPLTANRKVDRKALADLQSSVRPSGKAFEEPTSPFEKIVAEAWTQVLGLDKVGLNDDFFVLGGHSLLSMQVLSRIRKAYQIDLPLSLLFTARTVADLARKIQETIEITYWHEISPATVSGPDGNARDEGEL